MAQDELKAAFLANLEGLKAGRVNILREHLRMAQTHQVKTISVANGFSVIGNRYPHFLDYDLAEEEIDSIFSGLEAGVSSGEKAVKISALQGRMDELRSIIEGELSPRERWFYTPSGIPIRYPKGCRWTRFVDAWKEVVSRHTGPVDLDGYKIVKAAAMEAYSLLGLDGVFKKTPLSEGRDRSRQ